MRDINRFSEKWLAKFQNEATPEHEIEEFGRECAAIGLTMDCGESIKAVYPDIFIFRNADELRKIICIIDDAKLLGNAIFSQWRYYTHWACAPIDREWFIVALSRLKEISLFES